jgi:peroxiredoxin
MSDSTREFQRGQRLPAVSLRTMDARPFALSGRRGPLVLLAVRLAACAGCGDYIDGLGRKADEIALWSATLILILRGGEARSALSETAAGRFTIVTDPAGVFVAETSNFGASIVIADEWREIHLAQCSIDGTDLPSPDEVTEWVRFVAIQCPECEQPEGEWREI